MTIDNNDLINSILESFDRIDFIRTEEIPSLPLYMDQVTTLISSKLTHSTRNPEEDKILTKTMINNYAKNSLLPAPDKKKYTKEHILLMIFIYYFKNFMLLSDIKTILEPITEKYFDSSEGGISLEDIYKEVTDFGRDQIESAKREVKVSYEKACESFKDAEDRDFLQTFSFICMLSFDVYVKKLLIEKLIDGLNKDNEKQESQKESKKDKK